MLLCPETAAVQAGTRGRFAPAVRPAPRATPSSRRVNFRSAHHVEGHGQLAVARLIQPVVDNAERSARQLDERRIPRRTDAAPAALSVERLWSGAGILFLLLNAITNQPPPQCQEADICRATPGWLRSGIRLPLYQGCIADIPRKFRRKSTSCLRMEAASCSTMIYIPLPSGQKYPLPPLSAKGVRRALLPLPASKSFQLNSGQIRPP